MLIDFTVGNYRSIREPVTLSAVEAARGPGKTRQGTGRRARIKPDNEIAPAEPIPGRGIALLPVLGIFGPNESGKTNLLRALDDLLWLMTVRPARHGPLRDRISPFGLDRTSAASPTNFRLRVAEGGRAYTYALAVDRRRVNGETLTFSPPGAGEDIPLFERRGAAASPSWQISERLTMRWGEIHSGCQPSETLMSRLNEYERDPDVGPLCEWIRRSERGVSRGYEGIKRRIAAFWTDEQPDLARPEFLRFLRGFDTTIVDLQARKALRGHDPDYSVIVYHDTAEGRIGWPLEEESLGTQRLFEMAPKILWTLRHGTLALFDELGSNLHPHLTERIVRLFQSAETNPRRGQLIFTSHDNTLLQGQLLRRDQVWLTEKRRDGSTDLYSLSDFRPRNDLVLDKAYLDGRFGAVPVLPAEADMIPADAIRS